MAVPSVNSRSWSARAIRAFKRDKYLILMFLPIFIWYVIFKYWPMPGVIIAFKDFKPGNGIYNGEWVGLKWFIQFFESPFAFRLIKNTLLISVYSILFSFPIPIIFAITITEIKNSAIRRTVQTVSYFPHFISTVVVCGILTNFLSANDGLVNNLIELFGGERTSFLMEPQYFRTIYIGSGIWQGFGYSAIIYISAIMGVDPSLYESAKIDGITKFKEVIYITIPMIAPTIIVLFIMRLGNIMDVGFEKVFLLSNDATLKTADVISTYVYRMGIGGSKYSLSAAIGLFNTMINFALVFGANQISRRVTNTSLW